MNRTVLTAQLAQRGVARYTPAGVQVCDFILQHESQVTEAGQPRKVSMEIRAVAIGDIAQRLLRQEIGMVGTYVGFLTNQRNGRGIVFHVTEVQ